MSLWRAYLADPYDNSRLYGTLRPHQMRITWKLSAPGTCDIEALRVPGTREMLWDKDLFPFSGGGFQPPGGGYRLASTSFCALIFVLYDEMCVWSGIVWDISGGSDSQMLTLHCEDFSSFYTKVLLDYNFSIASQTTLSILQQLLDPTVNASAYNPFGLSFSFATNGGTYGTYAPRWYSYEHRTVAQCIDEVITTRLAAGQDPIEWRCQVEGGIDAGGRWDVVMRFYAGMMGSLKTWPSVEWGPKTKNTIDSFRFTWSMKQAATRVKVPAFGERSQQIIGTAGAGSSGYSLSAYTPRAPRIDHVEARPDLRTQAGANEEAARILYRRAFPYQLQASVVRRPNSYFDAWWIGEGVQSQDLTFNPVMGNKGPMPGDSFSVLINDGNDVSPTPVERWATDPTGFWFWTPRQMRMTEKTLNVTDSKEEIQMTFAYENP